MDRRTFFIKTALSSGGLLLSTMLPIGCVPQREASLPDWEPNFFVRISPENTITFICSQSEIGQGTSTGLAMVLADELGARFEDLQLEFATGSSERYFHLQDTGGSNGVRLLWNPLREAAATVRAILFEAAAKKWECAVSDCYAQDSAVHHKTTDQQLPFGELLEIAAQLPAPLETPLKPASEYRYIGQPMIGPKTYWAARGATPYSINLKLPDMVYAAIARCPVWGGTLKTFDASQAESVPGVLEVFEIEPVAVVENMDYKGGVRAGVVVVAENTWAAFEGKKALEIEWEMGPNAQKSHEDLEKELEESALQTNKVAFDYKNGQQVFRKGKNFLKAAYVSPFQTNACMEPLNAVAYHKGHQVEIWAGTQAPQLTRERIAEVTGLPQAAVTVHNQPSGGGYGRRYFVDFVEEAVTISGRLRRPVKLTWSREDTIQTSKYHPLRKEYWEAALDSANQPIALSYKGVVSRPGGYRPFPYGLPTAFHERINYKDGNLLPRASWRSVFAHPWGLGLECFIDELAIAAGADPVQYRIGLLEKAEVMEQIFVPWVGDNLYPAKLKRTLEVVAEKAKWGSPLPVGHFHGVSAFCYNTSYCSQVAEVSVEDGRLKVHRFTIAIDCGLAVNPAQVIAQVEGSVIWGLSALLKSPITVENGIVQQQNFDTYDLLRIDESPAIDVVIIDSEDPPSGTGEVVVPGVAPAVLNACFAATGQRIRQIGSLTI